MRNCPTCKAEVPTRTLKCGDGEYKVALVQCKLCHMPLSVRVEFADDDTGPPPGSASDADFERLKSVLFGGRG